MAQPTNLSHPLLDEREVATILKIEPTTLRRWRWSGDDPRFMKIGGAVRYHPIDIDQFMNSSRTTSTSATGAFGREKTEPSEALNIENVRKSEGKLP